MKVMRVSVVMILGVLVMATGCASKKQTTKQINSLEAQVGALTDEVARLDRALQESRAGGGGVASVRSSADEGTVSGGIYRTPSGFELPSADVQEALKNAGYYQGAVDGKIGPATRDAIRAFQKDQGLEPDGVVGRRTWAKLKSYIEQPGK